MSGIVRVEGIGIVVESVGVNDCSRVGACGAGGWIDFWSECAILQGGWSSLMDIIGMDRIVGERIGGEGRG